MCLWIDVMNSFMRDSWNNEFRSYTTSNNPALNILSHFLLHLTVATTTLPKKRVSNTSSDCGVNSPHVLLPAMPVTSDILRLYIMQLTSRLDPSSGPLTPIQQFIHINSKSKNNERKYYFSQPDHPDPQSVLRTLPRQSYKL